MSKKDSRSSDHAVTALSSLSKDALNELFETYRVWIRSGEASLINAYAGSRAFADLLHSMGLLTDGANNAIGTVDNIFATAEILASITGSLKPSLQARTEAKSEKKGKDDEGDDLSEVLSAATSAAVQGAIEAGLAP